MAGIKEVAEEAGLRKVTGVLINRVTVNSGAADAGLQEGDIILTINGSVIASTSELQEMIGRYRPSEKIKIDYWRAEKSRQVMIELKDQNNNKTISCLLLRYYKNKDFMIQTNYSNSKVK